MILNLISLATVKAQLGISVTTYDIALTALLPVVSADVRRILNEEFNRYYSCAFSSSSALIDLSIYTQTRYENLSGFAETDIKMGTVVYHPNLPADTYIKEFNPISGLFTLSATPTGTGDYIYPTISIAQWPTISKMIWYKYSKQNTSSADMRGVSSESYGPVSVTYSDSEINSQWDYPQRLVDDLGRSFARVG